MQKTKEAMGSFYFRALMKRKGGLIQSKRVVRSRAGMDRAGHIIGVSVTGKEEHLN